MLTLIPTPIGNLEDITLRAIRLLRQADAVLAEDTRVTQKLLKHLEIDKPTWAYHAHNEHKSTSHIIEQLQAGKNLVLVSDAGTPAISDPGFLLVRACLEAGVEVECLPGACAIIPAIVMSGLPCDRFFFEGFLPHKKGRQTRLNLLSALTYTFVLYESPHRLVKTLEQLRDSCGGDRVAVVCRELTKLHEQKHRGTLAELFDFFQKTPDKVRGEIVIVVAGLPEKIAAKGNKYAHLAPNDDDEADENED
jgi:16S rRNA (cytidine1402-2'-O)-methyltransferase